LGKKLKSPQSLPEFLPDLFIEDFSKEVGLMLSLEVLPKRIIKP